MTDTPHFTAMDAYRAVYQAAEHPRTVMWEPDVFLDGAMGKYPEQEVDGYINFDTLADHINAAIAEAVKAEREACAEIAYKACDSVARDYDALTKCKTKSHPRWVQEIGKGFARLCREDAPTAIRARGAK